MQFALFYCVFQLGNLIFWLVQLKVLPLTLLLLAQLEWKQPVFELYSHCRLVDTLAFPIRKQN